MRRRVFLPLVLVSLVLVSSMLVRHAQRIRAQSQQNTSPATPNGGQQTPVSTYSLFCGLWRVDRGFVSTIHVKNSLVVGPLEVTPVVFMADGTEYDLPAVTLATAGAASLNVNDALANAPASLAGHLSQYGSAALRYQYRSPGHVVGSIEIINIPQSLIFTYPFNGVDSGMLGTQTLEGLWWRHDPGVSGFVALADVTDAPIEVSLQPSGSQGTALAASTVQVPAHSTEMLDLDSLVGALPGLENQAGGLRVQYNGPMGAIIASGGLVNEREGYSANMPFWSHDLGSSSPAPITYASAGLMIGQPDPMMGFPRSVRFTPYATVRNTTANPLSVAARLDYMSGGAPISFPLPDQQLKPLETRQLDFHSILGTLSLENLSGSANLSFSFTGHAGELVLAAGSVDETGNYVFAVEPEGVAKSYAKTGAYWLVANGFDTVYSLWNPTSNAQDFVATFYYADGSGKYQLPVHLDPQASTMIDMVMLIETGQPDPNGNVIPATVHQGSVVFESAKGKGQWMTLVVSGAVFNPQTATCGTSCTTCCGYSGFTIGPSPFYCLVNASVQCNATASYCDGSTTTFSASWSSDNTAVATVGSSTGLVTGVSPGTANITATFPFMVVYTGTICSGGGAPSCPAANPGAGAQETTTPSVSISGPVYVPLVASGASGPNQVSLTSDVNPPGGTYQWSTSSTKVTLSSTSGTTTTVTSVSPSGSIGDVTITLSYCYTTCASASTFMTVQQPSQLSVASNISSGAASCSAGQSGPDRQLYWQVQDQFGGSIQFVNMPQSDSIAAQGANGCNPPGNTNGCNVAGFAISSGFTNSAGQFPDHYSQCSSCCFAGIQCTTTVNQTYNISGFNILKNPVYTCSSITINGQ